MINNNSMRQVVFSVPPALYRSLKEEADRKADIKIQELKKEMADELSNVLKRQQMSEGRTESLIADMRTLIDRVVDTSRQVDTAVREETLRKAICGGCKSCGRVMKLCEPLPL